MKYIKKYSNQLLVLSAVVVVILLISYSDSCFVTRINHISNILLALLTATYVVFTYKILSSTRPRPLVFAHLPASQDAVYLFIKNIGNRPAYNVVVEFDPPLDIIAPDKRFEGAATPMLKQSFIPPDTEMKNYITSPIHILNGDKTNSKFKVTIYYEDTDRNIFYDSYFVDLSSYIFEKHFFDTKK